MVEAIIELKDFKSKRYDITIEDNNNFYANGILVHNCQNVPWVLQKYQDEEFYVTEKLDGQSATYWYKRPKLFGLSEFGICSRTVRKNKLGNSNWNRVAKLIDIENKLKTVGKNIAIQGEIIGSNIQGNPYKLIDGQFDFYVFNVYDIDKKEYYDLDNIDIFCSKFGFKMVPVLNKYYTLPPAIDEIIKYSSNDSVINKDSKREGIVVRSYDQKISFKAVSPEYLLSRGE